MNESSPVCEEFIVLFPPVQSSVPSHGKWLWIIFHVKSVRTQTFRDHSQFANISWTQGTQRLHMQRAFWSTLAISCCSTWIIFSRYWHISFLSFCGKIRTKGRGWSKTVPVKVVTNIFKALQFTKPTHIYCLINSHIHPVFIIPFYRREKWDTKIRQLLSLFQPLTRSSSPVFLPFTTYYGLEDSCHVPFFTLMLLFFSGKLLFSLLQETFSDQRVSPGCCHRSCVSLDHSSYHTLLLWFVCWVFSLVGISILRAGSESYLFWYPRCLQ